MDILILSGGEVPSRDLILEEISWADYIICADHGYDMLTGMDRIPDLLVGDLDSIKDPHSIKARSLDRYDSRKNDTDTGLALQKAVDLGPNNIHILGGTGSRLDHSLANIFLLEKHLDTGVKIQIINDCNRLSLFGPGSYKFCKSIYKYLSLLSLTEKSSYSTTGFEYEVDKLLLNRGTSRGVSNEIKAREAWIEVHFGKVLIIESRD